MCRGLSSLVTALTMVARHIHNSEIPSKCLTSFHFQFQFFSFLSFKFQILSVRLLTSLRGQHRGSRGIIMQGQPQWSDTPSCGHKREQRATDDQAEGPSPGPGWASEVSPDKHRLRECCMKMSFHTTLSSDGTVAMATKVLERDMSKERLKKKKTICGLNKNMWRCKGCCKAFIATC